MYPNWVWRCKANSLSDNSSIYEVGEQRQQLIAFHDELQLFVEALLVICSRSTDDVTIKEKIVVNKISLLLMRLP